MGSAYEGLGKRAKAQAKKVASQYRRGEISERAARKALNAFGLTLG